MIDTKKLRKWDWTANDPDYMEVIYGHVIADEIDRLRTDNDRLKANTSLSLAIEVSKLEYRLRIATEALEKINKACQCETDDRDVCFGITVEALAKIKGGL